MSLAMRLVLLFALTPLLLCAPAQASDYEVGTSLVRDTQARVERFIALFTGDVQAAIGVVNAEEQNPSACVIRNVAYMRGIQVGIARHCWIHHGNALDAPVLAGAHRCEHRQAKPQAKIKIALNVRRGATPSSVSKDPVPVSARPRSTASGRQRTSP
jgi:hypothetical protein